MKQKIVIIGSSNTDMVMRVKEFPKPGETILGEDFLQNLGGKGANQAVACARLGGDTAFVGKLGKDALGDNTLKVLSQEKLDLTYLTQTPEAPSGTAFITVDSHGENSIVVVAGANNQLSAQDIDDADALLREASVVLMQLESPVETLAYAAQKAHNYGAKVVLNPAPAPTSPLPKELLQNVDLLIPNETEAQKISGMDAVDESNLKECIHKIQTIGISDVVITLGSHGAATLMNDEPVIVPAVKVKPVDTTAAGDTFCGALCVMLAQGKDLKEAITFACKASSVTCTRMGAQQSIPSIEELGLTPDSAPAPSDTAVHP